MGLHEQPHRIWSKIQEGSDHCPTQQRSKEASRFMRDRGSDHRERGASLMMLTCRDVIGRRGRGDTGYAMSCACVPAGALAIGQRIMRAKCASAGRAPAGPPALSSHCLPARCRRGCPTASERHQ